MYEFRLTANQNKIVKPLLDKAKEAYDEDQSGVVIFQVVRRGRGRSFAKGNFIPKFYADQIGRIIKDWKSGKKIDYVDEYENNKITSTLL